MQQVDLYRETINIQLMNKLKLFLLLIQAVSLFASANEQIPNKEEPQSLPQVEWYKPETSASITPNTAQVSILGKTKPGTKIRLSGDEILIVDSNSEVQQMKTTEAFRQESVLADENGYFELRLTLPLMMAQLSIEVQPPQEEAKFYQISILVKQNSSEFSNLTQVKTSPYSTRKWGAWAGLGYNYANYAQSSSIPSNLFMNSFQIPSVHVHFVRNFEHWQVQGVYTEAPGKTNSSDSIAISRENFKWTSLEANATHWKPNWKSTNFGHPAQFGIIGGIQYQIVPFFVRSSATNPQESTLDTNTIVIASIGGAWQLNFDKLWKMEAHVRYQIPVQSGSLFKVSQLFGLDGSIGVIHKWKPDLRVGIFMYGQYQNIKYRDKEDTFLKANSSGNPNISGEQKVLNFPLEARIGWEFD